MRDEWPNAVTTFEVQPRGGDKAYLKLACPQKGDCLFSLWQRPAQGAMWQWNGDVRHPTITPSIDCRGGCGRHFTMTNGVAQ